MTPAQRQRNLRCAGARARAAGTLAALAILASGPAAAHVVQLPADRTRVPLTAGLEALEDPTGALTVDEVAAGARDADFVPVTDRTFRRPGGEATTYWLRLAVQAPAGEAGPWILTADYCIAVSVSVYQYAPATQLRARAAGWTVQTATRSDAFRSGWLVDFPVVLAADAPTSLLLRVTSDQFGVHLPLGLSTRAARAERLEWRMLGFGLFYGIVLLVGLIHLVMYVWLRDRNYLWYTLFLGGVLLYHLVGHGLIARVVHVESATFWQNLVVLTICLMAACSAEFSRGFLLTRKNAPWADWIILGYIGLCGLTVLTLPLGSFEISTLGITTLGFLAPVAILVPGITRLAQGYRPARTYLVAWAAFALGAALLPVVRFQAWSGGVFQVAAGLSALLFGLAQVQRIRALRARQQDAERSARESERRFRAVFNQSFQFMALTDPAGRILEVNSTGAEFFGLDPESQRGQLFWERNAGILGGEVPGPVKEIMIDAFRRAAAGEQVRLENEAQTVQGGHIHLDGSITPVKDGQGEVVYLILEGHDVTELVHATEALRQTHDQLEATINALPDLFFEVGADGVIHDVRTHDASKLHMPPETFLGQPLEAAVPPDVAEIIRTGLDAAREDGTHTGEPYALETPGGRGWYEPSIAVKGDPRGRDARFIVLIRDVTDRMRAEAETLRREAILKALAGVGRRLFAVGGGETSFVGALEESLAELGTAAEASSVDVFQFDRWADGSEYVNQLAEWNAPDYEPVEMEDLPEFDLPAGGMLDVFPGIEQLTRGEPVQRKVSGLDSPIRELMEAQGVKAFLSVPIVAGGELWGVLGIADARRERSWSDAEIAALQHAAGTFAAAVERDKAAGEILKFKAVADNANVGISIFGRDLNLIYCNPSCAWSHGYEPTELIGKSVHVYYPAEERAHVDALLAALRAQGGFAAEEVWHQRKDGTTYPTLMNGVAVKDAQGQTLFYAQTAVDISDRKQAEASLRESERRYRTIFETAGSAMIIFDQDGTIQLANQEFEILTGYRVDEVVGKMTWMPFFSEQSLKKMTAYNRLRTKDPDAAPRSYEATIVDRQGRSHVGLVMIDVVPGTRQRVAGFLDLTERKQAEQQMLRADKMAALGQIIAGVAHEINNPNNFIYFNLPILRRYLDALKPLVERQAEHEPGLTLLNMSPEEFQADVYKLLENMEHGSERITGIVAELKNYIRGHDLDERRPGNLSHVIDHVMGLVGKQVQKMVRRFDVEVADDLPPVLMNPGKLEQVLINLIINAGHAADKEDAWIRLTAGPHPEAGDWIAIEVEDNGVGIPPEVLPQIFDPFFTTKGRDAGTGLGLAISQRIVDEHGGRISVDSEEGQGTRFTILLPAHQAEAPAP